MSKKNNKKRKSSPTNANKKNNVSKNKAVVNSVSVTETESELHEEADSAKVKAYVMNSPKNYSIKKDDSRKDRENVVAKQATDSQEREDSKTDEADKDEYVLKHKPLSECRKEWQWHTHRIPNKPGVVGTFFAEKIFGSIRKGFAKLGSLIAKGYKRFIGPHLKKATRCVAKKTAPARKAIAIKLQPAKDKLVQFYNSKNVKAARIAISDEWYKIRRTLLYIYEFMLHKATKTSMVLAFISIMIVEACSRRSLGAAVAFIYQSPGRFLLNYIIVLAPFLLAFAVKRKFAIYSLFTALWVVIGVTDYYLLSNRTTPFTGVDIMIDFDEISVIFTYLSKTQTILISVCLILALLLIIALFLFSPETTCRFGRVKSALVVVGEWITIYVIIMLAISMNFLTTKFGNLGISYHNYGLPYCFIATVVDTGIAKPSDYSEEKIDKLVASEQGNTASSEKKTKDISKLPNIIFVQLESFIDPKLINNGVKFSEDPIPFFTSLRKKYSSGYLTVPTVVAGTCNTEFEVISGMSLEFFGPGEYPYKTILKDTTCESIAFDLKNIGYSAHTIHNHTAGFYGRNNIFANFGFDSFTAIEMMHDYVRVPSGRWATDNVIPGCIMDCLKSTKTKDVVYTITVQTHGIYSVDTPPEQQVITVSGLDDEELSRSFNYYVNQQKQVDNMLKELVNDLSNYDEDVVLVLYGDHIPGLSLSDSMFKDKTIYETEFVIWDNMGLEKKDCNLTSYQLAAEVFDRVGIHEGTIFKYHQNTDYHAKSYLSDLESLQYDMLYGNRYVYNGKNPYERTDIKYGVKNITIDKATYDGEYLYIEGGYFSNYTKLFINDERVGVERISSTLMRTKIDAASIPDGTILTVHQINALGTEFYCSPQYVYKNNQYPYTADKYQKEINATMNTPMPSAPSDGDADAVMPDEKVDAGKDKKKK